MIPLPILPFILAFLVSLPAPRLAVAACTYAGTVSSVLEHCSSTSSALHQALFERNEPAVMKLLEQRDLANAPFPSGNRPLHVLAEVPITEPGAPKTDKNGTVSTRLMKALLKTGADPDAANALSLTPLMVIAISGGDPQVQIDKARTLIEGGASINRQDDVGNTALIYAAQAGCAKLVALLTERGANTTIRNNGNETAADVALRKGYPEVARRLSR